jgi:glucan 1,3-beta-glucosidase
MMTMTKQAYDKYTPAMKAGFLLLAQANMDAYGDHFFWTWKTGYSPALGKIANPQWNYQLGLAEGYMPTNPRSAIGTCASLNPSSSPLPTPTLTPGTGVISPAQYSSYSWPPTTIGVGPFVLIVSDLPLLTPTGTINKMSPQASPTSLPIGYGSMRVDVGSGWTNHADDTPFFVKKNGYIYLDPWSGVGVAAPPVCAA